MNFEDLILLAKNGLPLWILLLGGLLSMALDALLDRKGVYLVYLTGVITFVLSLILAFKQWLSKSSLIHGSLLMDPLTLFFVFVIILVGLFTLLNSFSYLKITDQSDKEQEGTKGILTSAVVPLTLFAVFGMIFLFAFDNLIVNFIGLETMSLAIYVLVGSNPNEIRSQEAAIKYFVLGSVASAILLYGIVLLYAAYGSFELSQMGQLSSIADKNILVQIATVMLMVGIFFKLAVAPFHFWAPDVYEGAPAPITGFMASGVKVAAFALLIRVLLQLNVIPSTVLMVLFQIGVILTLLIGNLGALVQSSVKRMLAYSSIAHAGYLLLGLMIGFKGGEFDPTVVQAVLFYLLSYTLMTLGAFAVLSVLIDNQKEASQFTDLIGLGYSRPFVALAFSVFMISFLGIPPTVGFMAKYGIFSYAVKNGYIGIAIFGVVMSLVSAAYYLRPLVMMYFKGKPTQNLIRTIPLPLMVTLIFCFVAVLYLGFNPVKYLHMAELAVQAFSK